MFCTKTNPRVKFFSISARVSISIHGFRFLPPSFAYDISLLASHPSFLQTFMNICFDYGVRWRYEFNNLKSHIVTFGETKSRHFISMNKRSWF